MVPTILSRPSRRTLPATSNRPLRSNLPGAMTALTICASLERRELTQSGAMGKYRHVSVHADQVPLPRPVAGQALVRIHYVAVCGSDVHAVQCDEDGWCCSSVPATGWEQTGGQILGHEYAGEVVAVGPGIDSMWVGRAVTGDSLIPCRHCSVCRQGSPNACPHAYLIGLEAAGVFSEFAVVPASSLQSLGRLARSFGEDAWLYGCLAEPLGVAAKALHEALRCLTPRAERSLLIHGGGPLGACVGVIGRALGFHPVVVIEPLAARRAALSRCGVSAFDLDELDGWDYPELFGQGAAVAVDVCGMASTGDLLTGLRPAGVLVRLARTGRNSVMPQDQCITNGVKVVHSRGHVGFLRHVLRWMVEGRIDPRPLITHQLAGLEELHDWLLDPTRFDSACKVVCRVID